MMKYQNQFLRTISLLAALLCLLMAFATAAVAESEPLPFDAACSDAYAADAELEWEQSYIEVSREGIVDKIPVETVRVVNFDTTIATVPEYFTYKVCDGIDTFAYEHWQGEREVYYSVYHIENTCPSDLSDVLFECYGENYASKNVLAVKVGSYDATAVLFDGENASPAYQRHFFIIPVDDGCLVIETQFDFEMYEGLYRIMMSLFDTLQIG